MGQRRSVLTPEKSPDHRLGAQLREYRDAAGLSLADLALRVNCNAGFLGRLERADRHASITVIEAIDLELHAEGDLTRLWHEAEEARASGTGSETVSAVVVPAPRLTPKPAAIADGADYQASATRAVTLLEGLASADISDNRSAIEAGWAPAAVPPVITGYLFGGPSWTDCVQLSPAEVPPAAAAQQIRDTVRTMMELDFRHGGGHVRRMLLSYARHDIVPLLRKQHPDPVRRDLFSAAAEVAQLLGWAAYDAARHGLAQRYFVQGLRLSAEADDVALGGRLLANMSHQANYLGNYGLSLQLARSAQQAAGTRATPTLRAMCMAMEARALASAGDSRECARVLYRAEAEFGRREPGADPEWISYFDAAELAGEGAHCARDLGHPEEITEFASRALDPTTPPRTKAFIDMVIAAGALRAGRLDEALALATSAVNAAGNLQSARALRYITDFQDAAAAHHAGHPAVRQFTRLVAGSYPALEPGSGDLGRTCERPAPGNPLARASHMCSCTRGSWPPAAAIAVP